MFFLFLILFLSILIIFLAIFSILMFHLFKYRLPQQDHTNQLVIFFIIGSAVLLLIDLVSFFNIPWDLLNF